MRVLTCLFSMTFVIWACSAALKFEKSMMGVQVVTVMNGSRAMDYFFIQYSDMRRSSFALPVCLGLPCS